MFSIPCSQSVFHVAAAGHMRFSQLIRSIVRRGGLRIAASLVVSLGLLGGGAFGASSDSLRKIVVFQDGTSAQVQQQVVARSGSQLLNLLALVNGATIALPTESAAQALAILQDNPTVMGVYEDLTVSGQDGGGDNVIVITPGEPPALESYPWGLKAIHVPETHVETSGLKGAGVTVAILDTGIDITHPDLSKNIKGGYNALAGQDPKNYQDDNGHGTHMAGIIAARMNNLGIIGAASQAKIMAVKVLNQNGGGRLSDLLNGLGWVQANKIKVVNMSLGFSEDSPLLEQAIKRLYDAGVIMVASAGNQGVTCAQDGGGDDGGGDDGGGDDGGGDDGGGDDGGGDDGGGDDGGGDDGGGDSSCQSAPGGVNYPARYLWVISVAATNGAGEITAYSQSGPKVDIAAPGGSKSGPRILSTNKGGGYGWGSGTSQAAAHVSGAITLVLQKNPKMSFDEVLTLLQSNAADLDVPEERQGAGLIDVEAMINALR
jgi:subtilisin family serine protease